MRLILISALLASVTTTSPSFSPSSSVLTRSLAASGGSAWSRIRTLDIRYKSDSGPIDYLEDVDSGRYVVRTAYKAAGFDGVSVWTQPKSEVAYVLGDRDSMLSAANDSYRTERAWWFPNRMPATIASEGIVRDGNEAFDVIDITPAGGRPFQLWIDRSTHFIDRDTERSAERLKTTYYSNYHTVDGIAVPFTVRNGGSTEIVQKISVNVPISPSEFSLPSIPAAPISKSPVIVPFRLDNGEIIVAATLNGRGPYDCVFDTGGDLLLQPDVVKELGLQPTGRSRMSGGGEGIVQTSRGALQSVSIGGAPIGRQVFDQYEIFPEYPRRILAGLEILQRYVVQLNFDQMTMTLTPFEQFHYAGDGTVIPFHFQSNQPEIIGSIDGIAATMTIDTGDNSSLLLIAPFARKYGLIKKYDAHYPYGGSSVTSTSGFWAERVGAVEFNGVDDRPAISVSKPVTRISVQQFGFDANQYVSANIGIGILKQFNITFDYSRHELILEKSHFYGTPDVFNRSGVDLKRGEDAWAVRLVYDGSPAARSGIRTGDTVVRIDGKTPAELSDNEWSLLKRGPEGSTITFEIRRPDGMHDVAITLGQDIL